MRSIHRLAFAVVLLATVGAAPGADQGPLARALEQVLRGDIAELDTAMDSLGTHWDPRAVPMLLDTVHLSQSPLVSLRLLRILEQRTGQQLGFDVGAWWQWMWQRDAPMHPDYPAFKSRIYALVDPRFGGYFGPGRAMRIRLDEVVWGGVLQDGIPPLRNPAMLDAAQADYLGDDDVVFGIQINGDARAYPKRILAWHEMFTDTVGGVAVTGVYCTLCGAMILYQSNHDGIHHDLGTSGFLYRSNKLMYDARTQSLWTTLGGEPVIGPLAGKGIRLNRGSVITTTWGEWRRRHPRSRVLSLDTGHRRDYAEGAAYRAYFATDELMFPVPRRDDRLANKAEVLGLVLTPHADKPVALSVQYLADHPVHHDAVATLSFVVVTDRTGASRVYLSGDTRFAAFDGDSIVTGADGRRWLMTEDALTVGDTSLPRLPAHRAFWFGWYAAYPHTRLVH